MNLIKNLSGLPGVGEKTAERLAMANWFWHNDPYRHHVVIHNGVRLTKTLANRLALQQAGGDVLATQLAPVDQSVTADIRAAAALSSHVDKDVQVAAEKMIMKSKTLSKALETSRLVNDFIFQSKLISNVFNKRLHNRRIQISHL